jgi:hypothetical protein
MYDGVVHPGGAPDSYQLMALLIEIMKKDVPAPFGGTTAA